MLALEYSSQKKLASGILLAKIHTHKKICSLKQCSYIHTPLKQCSYIHTPLKQCSHMYAHSNNVIHDKLNLILVDISLIQTHMDHSKHFSPYRRIK